MLQEVEPSAGIYGEPGLAVHKAQITKKIFPGGRHISFLAIIKKSQLALDRHSHDTPQSRVFRKREREEKQQVEIL